MNRREDILTYYYGDRKNVVVPKGTKMIRGEEIAFGTEFEGEDRILWEKGVNAPFSRDKRIVTVSMDDSVIAIGPKAFEHCSNLKFINLSSNLEYIGLSAFLGCVSLKEIHLPKSLKRIDTWAFSFCSFDRVIFDGNIWEARKLFDNDTDLCTKVLETKEGVFNFEGEFFIDDYYFSGTEKEWNEKHVRHWLNKKARRIHFSDGTVLENEK